MYVRKEWNISTIDALSLSGILRCSGARILAVLPPCYELFRKSFRMDRTSSGVTTTTCSCFCRVVSTIPVAGIQTRFLCHDTPPHLMIPFPSATGHRQAGRLVERRNELWAVQHVRTARIRCHLHVSWFTSIARAGLHRLQQFLTLLYTL